MLLLPDTELANAREIAEKTRQLVRFLKIPHAGSDIDEFVTISAGVCNLIPEKNQSPSNLPNRLINSCTLPNTKTETV